MMTSPREARSPIRCQALRRNGCRLLVVALALTGAFPHGGFGAEDPKVVEKTVAFIEARETGDKSASASIGTGFLLASQTTVCLITASHVAKHAGDSSRVVLLVGDVARSFALRELAPRGATSWVFHEAADVAALRLTVGGDLRLHVFSRQMVLTSEVAPQRDRPIWVFGFPRGLGSATLQPVSQQYSRASEIERAKSDEFPVLADYYFLDRPSVQGYSGAPLFVVPGQFARGAGIVFRRDCALVGLMAGTLSDNTGGKLAAVVPPRFVAEIFDRAATQP